ncbi:MAG: DUF2786 domain-containing protein [Deltaproteobacteria bacterium]|jgi:hypothetical protein|nr:DUF2786 domain-containing protein [Deltaproteobacteria bacterium]
MAKPLDFIISSANDQVFREKAWRFIRGHHQDLLDEVSNKLRLNKPFRLRPVTIVATENARAWGVWNPGLRTITLLDDLLFHDYNSISGVLAHETAHYVVSTLYPRQYATEPSHGPTFKKICRLMCLDPFYWTASMDLTDENPPEPFTREGAEAPPLEKENAPLLAKVQKLLALATSSDSFEAAAALAAAEKILVKHNLSLPKEDDAEENEYARRLLNLRGRRDYSQHLILSILHDFFLVFPLYNVIHHPAFELREVKVEIIGKPVNIALAEHVYHFLGERLDTLWERYKPTAAAAGEKGLAAKNSFRRNLLIAFREKLEESRRVRLTLEKGERDLSANTGLILSELGERLSDTVKRIYPKLTRSASSSYCDSPLSSKAGREAGRELTIYQPVPGDRAAGGKPLRIGSN